LGLRVLRTVSAPTAPKYDAGLTRSRRQPEPEPEVAEVEPGEAAETEA
jgi:hypothetical protein